MPITVHTLEHLLQFYKCLAGLFPGSSPEFNFDDGAKNKKFGAVLLVTLAGSQRYQANQNENKEGV